MNKFLLGLTFLLVGVAGYMLAKVQYTAINNDINLEQESLSVDGYKEELASISDIVLARAEGQNVNNEVVNKVVNEAIERSVIEPIGSLENNENNENNENSVNLQNNSSVELLKKTIQELKALKAELIEDSN
ncbi:MAG: hypothetical protein ACI9YH_000149 [Colwellia sp.]|jgi:hypothetical protein